MSRSPKKAPTAKKTTAKATTKTKKKKTSKSISKSMENLRDVLLKRREALRAALDGDLSQLKGLQSASGDIVDVALDTAQDEISSQLAQVESRELNSIDKAIERINEGTYGLCEGCQNKIPAARIQALPYATTCINCQREAEKHGEDTNGDVDWSRILETSSDDSTRFSDYDFRIS